MEDPIYSRLARTPRPSLTAASALALLATAGLWLTSLAVWRLAPEGAGDSAFVNLLFYVPFVLLPVAAYLARRGGMGEALRLGPMPAFSTLTAVVLALLSVYAASALAMGWLWLLERAGLPAPEMKTYAPQTPRELAIAILTLAAAPAVCEELLFRGVVLAAWESRGTALAIGVSTAMFALIHGNLHGLPAYALVGAVSGLLVTLLDSLYAGITYHTVYNAACLVIPYLARDVEQGEAALSGAEILSEALELATMLLLMAMSLFTVRLRSRAMGIRPIPRIRRPLTGSERLWFAAAMAALVVTTLALA